MLDEALKDLPRLGDEALGPCAFCEKVILATGHPVFYRLTVRQCGVDPQAVRKRVGLAQQLGGGVDGLMLASVMGPNEKPVVVISSGDVNVCSNCAAKHPAIMTAFVAATEG